MLPQESTQKYVDKFWDLQLKVTIFKKIDFKEQKLQFCAGRSDKIYEYVNSQRPKTISAVMHHTVVPHRSTFNKGGKKNFKPVEAKEQDEQKGKNVSTTSSSKAQGNSNKAKDKNKGYQVRLKVSRI